MNLDLSDLIQRNIFLGSYEFDETSWVKRVLRTGDVALDLGANVGYYTALFAKIVGSQGCVVSIEPNPSIVPKLQELIAANGLKNVSLVPAGASDNAGWTRLYIPPASHHNDDATMAEVPGWRTADVPVKRIDSILEALGISQLRLLKMDIEGHEHRALRGAEQLIKSGSVKFLLTELNEYWLEKQGSSTVEYMAYCEDLGFRKVAYGSARQGSVLLEWIGG